MSTSKVNIRQTVNEHLNTFRGKDGSFVSIEKRHFLYYPIILASMLAFLKIPDNQVLGTFSICISVLIGLLLNLLVLVLSNSVGKNLEITTATANIRKSLIKETFYNISFTVIISIVVLIIIFLFNLDLSFLNYFQQFNRDVLKIPISIVKNLLSFLLYFFTLQVFIHLFMILKRINTLFSNDIEFEKKE